MSESSYCKKFFYKFKIALEMRDDFAKPLDHEDVVFLLYVYPYIFQTCFGWVHMPDSIGAIDQPVRREFIEEVAKAFVQSPWDINRMWDALGKLWTSLTPNAPSDWNSSEIELSREGFGFYPLPLPTPPNEAHKPAASQSKIPRPISIAPQGLPYDGSIDRSRAYPAQSLPARAPQGTSGVLNGGEQMYKAPQDVYPSPITPVGVHYYDAHGSIDPPTCPEQMLQPSIGQPMPQVASLPMVSKEFPVSNNSGQFQRQQQYDHSPYAQGLPQQKQVSHIHDQGGNTILYGGVAGYTVPMQYQGYYAAAQQFHPQISQQPSLGYTHPNHLPTGDAGHPPVPAAGPLDLFLPSDDISSRMGQPNDRTTPHLYDQDFQLDPRAFPYDANLVHPQQTQVSGSASHYNVDQNLLGGVVQNSENGQLAPVYDHNFIAGLPLEWGYPQAAARDDNSHGMLPDARFQGASSSEIANANTNPSVFPAVAQGHGRKRDLEEDEGDDREGDGHAGKKSRRGDNS